MERVLRALPFVFPRTENDCWVGTKGEVILQYIYIYICTYIYILIYQWRPLVKLRKG